MTNKIKIGFTAFILCAAMLCASFAFKQTAPIARASVVLSPLGGGDGTYRCDYTADTGSSTGQAMLSMYFDDEVKIEAVNEKYYFYITYLSPTQISQFSVYLENKRLGWLVAAENEDSATYMFCAASINLSKTFTVKAYVSPMASDISFSLTLNLNSAQKISENYDTDFAERPSEFVPEITVSGGLTDYTLAKGSEFTIANAEAYIGLYPCEVETSVFFKANNGNRVRVNAENNIILLEKTGTYYVVYSAASDRYLSSLGNPALSVKEIKITSFGNAEPVVFYDALTGLKVTDKSGMQDIDSLSSEIIDSGYRLESAAAKLNFKVKNSMLLDIVLADAAGKERVLSQKVEFSFEVPQEWDIAQTALYRLSGDGKVRALDFETADNSVVFEADAGGTFLLVQIIAESSVLKPWEIALICIAGIIAAAGVSAIVVLNVRKRKANGSKCDK